MPRTLKLKRPKTLAQALIVLAVAAVYYLSQASAPPQPPQVTPTPKSAAVVAPPLPTASLAYVVRVVDGDTIRVSYNEGEYTIRLIGVNTPETVDPRRPVQCFGKEASSFLKTILDGQTVTLTADPTQQDVDKYNRYLRYVTLQDGQLVNKLIISEGYGAEYTYEVPYTFQSEFKAAQLSALSAQKGLWNPTVCHT